MQCRLRPSNIPLEHKEDLDIYKLVVISEEEHKTKCQPDSAEGAQQWKAV